MTPEQFNILVNAGTAGVFAVFAVILFDRFTKFLREQNEQWQKFLETERQARNEFSARMAEEMKSIASLMNTTHALMSVHDQRVEHAMPLMIKSLDSLGKLAKDEPKTGRRSANQDR